MTLTITHTAAEGTLIDGTAKGDGSAEVLRTNGWRWSRALGSWYVPHSRDREPKRHVIDRTVAQLQEAGFTVTVSVDYARRAAAAVETDLLARREDRAAALDAKAERRADTAAAEAERAARALRRLPEGGEPIHVGHHSESAHRSAIAKADAAIRRSIDADTDARRARARADIAAGANEARYAPITVANRIEKLRADQVSLRRRLEGYSRTLPAAISTSRRRRPATTPRDSPASSPPSTSSMPTGRPFARNRSPPGSSPTTPATPSAPATRSDTSVPGAQ